MRALVVVAVAGCWSEPPPVASPAEPAAASGVRIDPGTHARTYRPARRSTRFPLHSEWEGTYRCAQGLSSVRLTIDARPDGEAIAVYEFGPTPSNTTVPSGSFSLKGTLAGGAEHFTGDFDADQWIVHPPSYFMVGLAVETRDPRTLVGSIKHASCSSFEARRID